VHDAVLEVRVAPELGARREVVGVPVLVLAAGRRVQVDDAVDAVLAARADRAVEALEARLDQLERLRVALEVAVVDGQADAGDAQLREELGVLGGEEAVEKKRPACSAPRTLATPARISLSVAG
jgi:hypothetical protein